MDFIVSFNLSIQEVTFNSKGGTVDEVWSMAKAKDGTYYYASFSKGFWQSKDNNKSWTQIPAIEKLKVDPLMKKGSYGSCGLSNGAVILTTSSGFYYLKNDKATAFDLYGKGAEVYSVLEDKSGKYAYINKWTYLFRLDLKTLKLDTVLTNYNLIGKAVMNLVQDRGGNQLYRLGETTYF
ncbi:MAG: hypothetical protein IPP79_08065 [Chitinophagaceae bacterium]|nr:hypothetical protein [Chitinophagaceae bacterium]